MTAEKGSASEIASQHGEESNDVKKKGRNEKVASPDLVEREVTNEVRYQEFREITLDRCRFGRSRVISFFSADHCMGMKDLL